MKIKVREMSYEDMQKQPEYSHIKPIKQKRVWRLLMKALSQPELKKTNFSYTFSGLENIGDDEPCLFLMNHSSFTDLQIAAHILAQRQYHIVCTNDGFVGKAKLMRTIGCIPAKKFINDITLIRDMKYAVDKLNSSILMYPEASYSFDGTTTPLPDSLAKFVKLLGIPVVMIKTHGAFLRDPLYNNLQKRQVDISAEVFLLVDKEDIKHKNNDEINQILKEAFEYDHFSEQQEKGITINEAFRADGLNRVLYKCMNCETEGMMEAKGTRINCSHCNTTYELTEHGELICSDQKYHIPDWYRWERECVRKELADGTYEYSADVDIMVYRDMQSIYKVGTGHLTHNVNGFELSGCNGAIKFVQKPSANYSLYSDYYWYEIGDMICIGDAKEQYYCFPQDNLKRNVAKLRLATEEMFKM